MLKRITATGSMVPGVLFLFMIQIFVACSSDVEYTPPAGSSDTAITHYSFGKMTVDGKTFEGDVMILPGQDAKVWKFSINHQLQPVDIQAVGDGSVSKLIIGTGASEATAVMTQTLDFLKSKGIEYIILNTYDAVRLFNKSPKQGLAAFFHINC